MGAFIGLFMLLLALQLWLDVKELLGNTGGGEQYVVINKKVEGITGTALKSNFSEEEIAGIESEKFVSAVGAFTANLYKVGASVKMFGFYTELFFESLPDRFIDVSGEEWSWEEGQEEVPIIMSKDYLALYNFGFAPSQGLPQFTAESISNVSFTLILRGKGKKKEYRGRIIGFSERLNSILVPQSFMDARNSELASGGQRPPSRLVLVSPGSEQEALAAWLNNKGYEISRGKLDSGRISAIARMLTSALGAIGLLLFLLAFLVMLLNIQLLIARARDNIKLLLELGYRGKSISVYLSRHLLRLFGSVAISALLALSALRWFLSGWLLTRGLEVNAWLNPEVGLLGIALAILGMYGLRLAVKKSLT